MFEAIKTATFKERRSLRLASALVEAINYPTPDDDSERCPVLLISPVSMRIIKHYNRAQAFGSGMGGTAPPCEPIDDADVRMVHGFNIITRESERLRKIERAAK